MKIFLLIHAHIVFKVVQFVLGRTVLTETNIGENLIFAFNFPRLCWGLSISTLNYSTIWYETSICMLNNFHGAFYFTITESLQKHYLFKYSGYFWIMSSTHLDKRRSLYPSISMCNVKSCICCSHLNCKSTIRSTVNGRHFFIVNTTDLDWRSKEVIYVLTCCEKGCGIQYVGQT